MAGRAARPGPEPRPALARVTDRGLPAAVLYPRGHVAGHRLPVLVDCVDPHRQGIRVVRADWLPRQRWADAGFAVVVVDQRGTPGVAPSFEKVVHRRLADLAVTDLADAVAGLAGKHPELDLTRVAVRGRGLGGWLAALAVLRAPETFRCGVAERPVTDWGELDPAFAERYLGPAEEGPEIYRRHDLSVALAELPTDQPPPLLFDPDPDADPTAAGGWLRWLRDRLAPAAGNG